MNTKYLFFALLISLCIYAQPVTETLEKRITDLELHSFRHRILLSGDFNNYIDVYHSKETTPTQYDDKLSLYRFSLGFNFSSKISEKLHFYGRIAGKYMYQTYLNGGNLYNSTASSDTTATSHISRIAPQYDDKGLKVEKAYFNYNLQPIPVTVSAGRLPTAYGLPAHIKDGLSRQATYPMIAYSLPVDAIAITWHILKSIKHSMNLRLIYTPLQDPSIARPYTLKTNINSGIKNSSQGFTSMLEYTKDNFIFGSDLIFILQNVLIQHGGFASLTDTTGTFHTDEKLVKFQKHATYLEFLGLFNNTLSTYFGYSLDLIDPKGQIYLTTNNVTIPQGSLWSDGYNSTTGHTFLTGVNYKLPIKSPLSCGFEYIYGSKYSVGTGFFDDQLIGFYYLRGTGMHGYLNKLLFNKSANIRLGMYYMKRNYDDNFFGAPVKSDTKILNPYLIFKLRF